MTEVSDNIFREYDIRGTYGEDLTPEVAELLGRAYAIEVKRHGAALSPDFRITVGRDVRLSSKAIRDALIKGLTSSGINC
ncbi:MAG: phosphomannomutase, partial [Deltaproteobacteria bacterium]|nr:phosphomannomutase [Deltaproteobacteria bacterium]